MSVNTNDGVDRSPSRQPDVCIIGAGPSGTLVANTLTSEGYDVVILEAGEWFDSASRIDQMELALRPAHGELSVWNMGGPRDDFVNTGEHRYPLNTKRVKGVGGSTLHWGARVARFPEKDFEMSTRYGVAADWPISYADLKPYYAQAEHEFGVAGADDNPFGPPRDEPYPMEAFPPSHSDSIFKPACDALGIRMHSVPNARNSETYDGRSVCVGFGTCDPVCPSGAKYSADVHARKAQQDGARIIDQAVVHQLETDSAGTRITAATYNTPSGRTYRQTADYFVLAAGAVENIRLLLLSRSNQYPDGLANSSGAVGKYLMESLYVGIHGELDTSTGQNQIGFGTSETYQFYSPETIPPGSFKLEFHNGAGPTLTEIALNQHEPLRNLRDFVRNPGRDTAAELQTDLEPVKWGDELREMIDDAYGNYFQIGAEIEVLPYEANTITLDSNRVDDYGNPVPNISWGTIGEYEWQTIDRAYEVIERIVDNLQVPVNWSERWDSWGGAGHPSGTTRMGTDPNTSVVDPNLRAHDLENLFISGSSVFVTSGASQPTLTIAALALRLGEHLAVDVL